MSKLNLLLEEWTVPKAQKISLRERHNKLHRNTKQPKEPIMAVEGLSHCVKHESVSVEVSK
jgi:hypothetical protein